MAAGSTARELPYQVVHFLRKSISFSDIGSAVTVGKIPAGATILKPLSGVNVDVVFNAGSTNVLDIGSSANDDLYGTDLALGSIAFVPLDEAVAMTVSAETTITATPAATGTAATTGSAEVVIAYLPDNDG
jgi:hypothetical protein